MCDPDKIKPEPIPGLPEELPEGERILWRGSPDWKALAMHVFHVRAVAIYFAALMVWRLSSGLSDGLAPGAVALSMMDLVPSALIALGLLSLLAWLIARSTIYTITTDRVVIRAGVALPKAINVPFKAIGSAALRLRKSGNGDIPLQLQGSDRFAYLPLWPHVRPWQLHKAEPMLRGLPEAESCAQILAVALAEKAGQPAQKIAAQDAKDRKPAAIPANAEAFGA